MDYRPSAEGYRPSARALPVTFSYLSRSQTRTDGRMTWMSGEPSSAGCFGPHRMTTTDDRLWLERARAGDRTAFGKLVRQHQPRVHRLALHLTGNPGEADDVTQETFLRAYRAITAFDARADLFTWL